MENLLNKLKFPYVHKLPTEDLLQAFDENRDELRNELTLLVKLRLPQRLSHVDNQARLKLLGWKPLPLLMQFFLKSLVVRFNFHFNGQQKTNDRQKVKRERLILAPIASSLSLFFSPNGF